MSTLSVYPVFAARDRRDFLNLPWQLHRRDPNWTPPLYGNQAELVGFRRHPFYDSADRQAFLVRRGGRTCGRLLAIKNHAYDQAHRDEAMGFIGFFECSDDTEAAHALLEAGRSWLAERGCRQIRGPVNPSMNYECGMLVQNFEMPATFMMTYNPPYYPALWESFGFEGVQDLFSFFGYRPELELLEQKVGFIAQEAVQRFKISLRPLRTAHFQEDVRTFLRLYNDSLTSNWGHVPMSEGELVEVSRGMRQLIVPELTVFAEVEGKPIGALFGLLDYNPRIKRINGRLFPLGFVQLLANRRGLKRLRVVSSNVLPEYQRWGIGVVLAYGLIEPALRWGVQFAEFSWVLESNQLSRKSLERAGLRVEKLHRIYQRAC